MLGVEAEAEFHFSAVVGHCKPVLSILFIYLFYTQNIVSDNLSHCKLILSILQTICVKTHFMHKTVLLQQAVASGQRHVQIGHTV